ncbi:MAG TPA: tetratricopeptide repeat protein [Planktothrix sp.]|jgi:tetratricopeptide (TPR) repeat protein
MLSSHFSSNSHAHLSAINSGTVAPEFQKEDFSRVVRRIKYTNSGQYPVFNAELYQPTPPPSPRVAQTREWIRYKELAESAIEHGNFSQAEAMWLSALSEANQFSSTDPRLALTLENLANLYLSMNRSEQAELFMRRAIDVNTEIYGPLHLQVANCLNNLGGILYNQRRFKEAEPICLKQLQIYESVYGSNHADVGMATNNLAMLYHAMGRHELAEQMYQRALQIRSRALGSSHVDVLTLRRNYLNLLVSMNKGQEAQELMSLQNAMPIYNLRDIPHLI